MHVVCGCASVSLHGPVGTGPNKEGLGQGALRASCLDVKMISTPTQGKGEVLTGLTLAPSNILSCLSPVSLFIIAIDPIIQL